MRTKAKKPTTLPLGTISHGTVKPTDLIPDFIAAMKYVQAARPDRLKLDALEKEFARITSNDIVLEGDEDALDEVLVDVMTIMENYVPAYCRFGSHEGDGSDYGVWVDDNAIDFAKENDDLHHGENPPQPDDYNGNPPRFWLQTNDHGNATLFRYSGLGKWAVVWSVV